jgi:hypothetical protein
MTTRRIVATFGRKGTTVSVVSLIRRGERVTVVFWREQGTRKEKTIEGATKRDQEQTAKAFAEITHARLLMRTTDTPLVVAPVTVSALHEKFVLARGQKWKTNTVRNEGARWQKFADFVGAHTLASRITLETMDQFRVALRTLGHVEAEINRHVTTVKAVFTFGVERDHVMSKVPLYKPEKLRGTEIRRIDEYSPAEVRAVLSELKPRGKKIGIAGLLRPWRPWAVCWLTAASGKRCRSQVLPLPWTAVHFTRGGALVDWPASNDKLGKAHRQPMPRRAAALLRLVRWLAAKENIRSPWVFPAMADQRTDRVRPWYSYQALVVQLHAASARAGVTHKLGRALHGLRRYAANQVLESGGSIKDAGLWLNDSDLKVLSNSYLRERKGEQESIAQRMASPDRKLRVM